MVLRCVVALLAACVAAGEVAYTSQEVAIDHRELNHVAMADMLGKICMRMSAHSPAFNLSTHVLVSALHVCVHMASPVVIPG